MNLNRSYLKIAAKTSEYKRTTFQGTGIEGKAELKLASLVKNYIFNTLNLNFLKISKGSSFPKFPGHYFFSGENEKR